MMELFRIQNSNTEWFVLAHDTFDATLEWLKLQERLGAQLPKGETWHVSGSLDDVVVSIAFGADCAVPRNVLWSNGDGATRVVSLTPDEWCALGLASQVLGARPLGSDGPANKE